MNIYCQFSIRDVHGRACCDTPQAQTFPSETQKQVAGKQQGLRVEQI